MVAKTLYYQRNPKAYERAVQIEQERKQLQLQEAQMPISEPIQEQTLSYTPEYIEYKKNEEAYNVALKLYNKSRQGKNPYIFQETPRVQRYYELISKQKITSDSPELKPPTNIYDSKGKVIGQVTYQKEPEIEPTFSEVYSKEIPQKYAYIPETFVKPKELTFSERLFTFDAKKDLEKKQYQKEVEFNQKVAINRAIIDFRNAPETFEGKTGVETLKTNEGTTYNLKPEFFSTNFSREKFDPRYVKEQEQINKDLSDNRSMIQQIYSGDRKFSTLSIPLYIADVPISFSRNLFGYSKTDEIKLAKTIGNQVPSPLGFSPFTSPLSSPAIYYNLAPKTERELQLTTAFSFFSPALKTSGQVMQTYSQEAGSKGLNLEISEVKKFAGIKNRYSITTYSKSLVGNQEYTGKTLSVYQRLGPNRLKLSGVQTGQGEIFKGAYGEGKPTRFSFTSLDRTIPSNERGVSASVGFGKVTTSRGEIFESPQLTFFKQGNRPNILKTISTNTFTSERLMDNRIAITPTTIDTRGVILFSNQKQILTRPSTTKTYFFGFDNSKGYFNDLFSNKRGELSLFKPQEVTYTVPVNVGGYSPTSIFLSNQQSLVSEKLRPPIISFNPISRSSFSFDTNIRSRTSIRNPSIQRSPVRQTVDETFVNLTKSISSSGSGQGSRQASQELNLIQDLPIQEQIPEQITIQPPFISIPRAKRTPFIPAFPFAINLPNLETPTYRRVRQKKVKDPFYQPSATSVWLGIYGKEPKQKLFSGFEPRPIPLEITSIKRKSKRSRVKIFNQNMPSMFKTKKAKRGKRKSKRLNTNVFNLKGLKF